MQLIELAKKLENKNFKGFTGPTAIKINDALRFRGSFDSFFPSNFDNDVE